MLVLGLQGDRIEKQQRSIGMRSKDGFSSVSTNLLAARWWLWCSFGFGFGFGGGFRFGVFFFFFFFLNGFWWGQLCLL